MDPEKMLVGRHKKVAFMDADGKGTTPPITAILCAAIALCGFVYYQFVL